MLWAATPDLCFEYIGSSGVTAAKIKTLSPKWTGVRGPEELAESDQIDKGLLAQPAAANDKLLVEIADMRDGTAEMSSPRA